MSKSSTSSPLRDTHRDRLLQAARTLLRERDYGNITARDLVAASNTNLGSIGYHFGSKEALLNEAIGLTLEEWVEAIGRTTRGNGDGGLAALMASSLGAVLDDYDSIRPYHHAYIVALARSAHSPQLRQQLAAHYSRQRDRVATWISDAIGGTLRREEARHIASLMIATADGMLIQTFIDTDDTPSSRELAAATGNAIMAARDTPSPMPRARARRRPN